MNHTKLKTLARKKRTQKELIKRVGIFITDYWLARVTFSRLRVQNNLEKVALRKKERSLAPKEAAKLTKKRLKIRDKNLRLIAIKKAKKLKYLAKKNVNTQ